VAYRAIDTFVGTLVKLNPIPTLYFHNICGGCILDKVNRIVNIATSTSDFVIVVAIFAKL
jgi:hypothetical protein